MRRRSNGEQVDPAVQAARITRRGTVITAMGTVIAALIGGLFAAYKVGNDQGAAGVPPRTVTVMSTAPGANSPAGSAPLTSLAPTSGVPAQVRIAALSGIDVDASDPQPVNADGANGDIDLYFDGQLSANRSAIFRYSGTEKEAAVGCRNAVADDRLAVGGPFLVVWVGDQFCVRTSQGKVSWISCNDIKHGGPPSGYIVLNYRLFS
ncbi:hypothetical protein AB0F52_48490 [Amycolatopsis sp. NPDC024027]|uniref:hypothetical protein n=1 Tax=Amycolatopsis sp. NPDC024027 TaxID=3154327 RepID=UPI0033ECFA55